MPCWVPNTQQSVATVTSGWQARFLRTWDSSTIETSHVLSLPDLAGVKLLTYVRCCHSYDKIKDKSHTTLFHSWLWVSLTPGCDTGKRQSRHMTSFLDYVHQRAKNVLDFWTKVMTKVILPVMLIIKSAKSVSQDCTNTQDTVYQVQSNRSNAVHFFSINPHEHRINHSSAMLLWGMSKIADLPSVWHVPRLLSWFQT